MSVEEKIRRAEEIYNRRNYQNNYTYRSNSREKKQPTLMHRMIKQLIVCFIIYGVFYVVENRDYYLSEEFRNQVQEVASKNENLNKAYNYIIGYIDKYFNQNENNNEAEEIDRVLDSDDKTEEDTTLEQPSEPEQNLEVNDENIGGAEEVTAIEEKSQEEQDVEDIKNTISFIQPISGTITSTFGWRTPTTATVPKYHTGLDIAAPTGTVIKSATDGTVVLVSSQGDYGKHYKIQINDVIIIYAHCSKLYLNEGDTVHQGQEIAEVGSTGNSTRSTFTF